MSEIVNLEIRVDELQAQVNGLEDEVAKLEDKIVCLEIRAAGAEAEVDMLNGIRDSLEAENKSLRKIIYHGRMAASSLHGQLRYFLEVSDYLDDYAIPQPDEFASDRE